MFVMAERNPPLLSNDWKPVHIKCVWREVISEPLNAVPRGCQSVRNDVP